MSASSTATELKVRFEHHLTRVPQKTDGRPGHAPAPWSLGDLAGRLVELSADGGQAVLSLATEQVTAAQAAGEPVCWITRPDSTFYPPDAHRAGVNLDTLAVVRCPDARAIAQAADKLARSGAFGLIIMDLGDRALLPLPHLSRLAGLAQHHDTCILCLTRKTEKEPSLGSLVSLRGHAASKRTADGGFVCRIESIKDKRRGPGWSREVACDGPAGLH